MRLDKNTSKAIKVASKFIARRCTMPILSRYLVTSTMIQAGGFSKDGITRASMTLFVPTKINQAICLERVEFDEYHVNSDWTATTQEGSLCGISDSEYPDLFSDAVGLGASIHLTGNMWDRIVEVSSAASKDDTRYNLTFVQFEIDKKETVIVATDGHRLARAELNISSESERVLSIPAYVIRNLKDAEVSKIGTYADNRFAFIDGEIHGVDFTCVFTQSDSQFPEWRQCLPKGKQDKAVILSVPELIDSLDRVIKNTPSDKQHVIKVSLNGCLTINSSDPSYGACTYTIPIKHTGEDLTFGINAEYFRDCLSTSKLAVNIYTTNDKSPIIIQQSDVDWLVMPINPKYM